MRSFLAPAGIFSFGIEIPILGLSARSEAGHPLVVAHVGLREVLVEGVGIVEIIGLMVRAEGFVQRIDDLIERSRLAGAEVHDGGFFGLVRQEGGGDDVFDINMIAFLLAPFENSGAVSFHHLEGKLVDHA